MLARGARPVRWANRTDARLVHTTPPTMPGRPSGAGDGSASSTGDDRVRDGDAAQAVPHPEPRRRHRLPRSTTWPARRGVHLISPPVDLERDDARVVSASFAPSLGLPDDHVRIVIVSRLAESMKAAGYAARRARVGRSGRPMSTSSSSAPGRPSPLRLLGNEVNARLQRRAITFAGPAGRSPAGVRQRGHRDRDGRLGARRPGVRQAARRGRRGGWFRRPPTGHAAALFRNSFWSDEHCGESRRRPGSALTPLAPEPAGP